MTMPIPGTRIRISFQRIAVIVFTGLIVLNQLVLFYFEAGLRIGLWELAFDLMMLMLILLIRLRDTAVRTPAASVPPLDSSEQLMMAGVLAAGIAHEIRNPLTSLRGFVQLLRDKQPEYTDIMLSEIDRINSIVTELLQLARPRTGEYEHKAIKEVLTSVVNFMNSQANLHNIRLLTRFDESSSHTMLYCEANKLKQVFINLIKNGIESMPSGGDIHIAATRSGEHIHIVIRDQGTGMSQAQLNQLGTTFYTTKAGGTGLGLMITQTIIQEHHGTIQFSSEPGGGTTVTIVLPAISG